MNESIRQQHMGASVIQTMDETNDRTPCMYSMCIKVNDKIQEHPEVRDALAKSNLDDIVAYWAGSFLHSVYHIFKDLKQNGNQNWDTSVLFCGLSSQTMQLDWLVYSACYGQYDLAFRELRNILESAFLFYRADYDKNFRDKSLADKAKELENLKIKETYGKDIFQKSGYADWKPIYSNLYKKLCAYTHTEISLENAKALFNEFNAVSEPVYDSEKILDCIHSIQEVLVVECKLMESVLKEVYEVENAEFASIFKGE